MESSTNAQDRYLVVNEGCIKQGEIRNRGYYRAQAYALGGSVYCTEAYTERVVTLGPSVAKACQGYT